MDALHRKLNFYRWLAFVFVVLFFALLVYIVEDDVAEFILNRTSPRVEKDAPMSSAVEKVIAPLRYNFLDSLAGEDVTLGLDFKNRKWILHDVLHYDENGDIVLRENRYGLCDQLSQYTYNQVRPLFDRSYLIDFLLASRADYFPSEQGTHMVIRIIDSKTFPRPATYIIDPSFQRYGKAEHFEEYFFKEPVNLRLYKHVQGQNLIIDVGNGTPVLINREKILLLSVYPVEGRFDPDFYGINITAIPKYKFRSKMVYGIEKRGGIDIRLRADPAIAKTLSPDRLAMTEKVIEALYARIRIEDSSALTPQT